MSNIELVHERFADAPALAQVAGLAVEADPLMERLDRRIAWYDRSAKKNQLLFRSFKAFTLVAAAAIPFSASLSAAGFSTADAGPGGLTTFVAGLLGAAIVVVEGLQQLFQWQQNWLNYRSTSESLDRERSLFLVGAGSYLDVPNPRVLLAERIEQIMGQEHSKWMALSEQSGARRSDSANPPLPRGGA